VATWAEFLRASAHRRTTLQHPYCGFSAYRGREGFEPELIALHATTAVEQNSEPAVPFAYGMGTVDITASAPDAFRRYQWQGRKKSIASCGGYI